MIVIWLVSLLNLVFANPSLKWSQATQITERHEFYANNEVIEKPKDSWQLLLAIIYKDSQLKTHKDCLFYYVPGEDAGRLKVKTISVEDKCEKYLFENGNQEWTKLKALQFSFEHNYLTLSITDEFFQVERWDIPLFNSYLNPKPKLMMSSAEYRSPRFLFLTPYKGRSQNLLHARNALPDKTLCHDISEDCSEKSPSNCTKCENGWFEIPNGCSQGPKYCGQMVCGAKNRPACRRGMSFHKQEAAPDCRVDSSFAYCSKGLRIQCQGALPYCF